MFLARINVEHFKFVLVFLLSVPVENVNFDSPCSYIFQYKRDKNGNHYGSVQILKDVYQSQTNIQLNVQLIKDNNIPNFNGAIALACSRSETLKNILNGRPIIYKFIFPQLDKNFPRVIKIAVNGQELCADPGNQLLARSETINLQHNFYMNTSPVQSSLSTRIKHNANNNLNSIKRSTLIDIETMTTPPSARVNENNGVKSVASQTFYFSKDKVQRGKIVLHLNFPEGKSHPNVRGDISVDSETSDSSTITTTPLNLITSSSSLIQNFKPNQASVSGVKKRILPTSSSSPITTSSNTHFKPNQTSMSTVKNATNPSVSGRSMIETCGLTLVPNHLILKGTAVARGAFPWLTAMFSVTNTGLEYRCSGSLISYKHIVTAAHCVQTYGRRLHPSKLIFLLGKTNIQRWQLSEGEKMVEAEKIHVHSDYQPDTADADIAVIVLMENIQVSPYIRPICLWSEYDDLQTVVGKNGMVIGWGKDEYGNIATEEPKLATIPIVSQEQCLRSSATFHAITSNRTFCAGNRNGIGPCNGDSGSGFIMNINHRWMLRGVVSMSMLDEKQDCDLKNYIVFTDTSKFNSWILSLL